MTSTKMSRSCSKSANPQIYKHDRLLTTFRWNTPKWCNVIFHPNDWINTEIEEVVVILPLLISFTLITTVKASVTKAAKGEYTWEDEVWWEHSWLRARQRGLHRHAHKHTKEWKRRQIWVIFTTQNREWVKEGERKWMCSCLRSLKGGQWEVGLIGDLKQSESWTLVLDWFFFIVNIKNIINLWWIHRIIY